MSQISMPANGEEICVLNTNMGKIQIKFFREQAPKAVENFTTHVKNGYYNGVVFHRILNDFMIQGGDPSGTGMGGESIWGNPFEDEFCNELHNYRGSLSMANAGPNTNGSQFFIVQKGPLSDDEISYLARNGIKMSDESKSMYKSLGGTPWLDGAHTVFGYVFDGMDVVDYIASVRVNHAGKPLDGDVIIQNAEIKNY